MGDIGKWLDSIGAPRHNERGWAYTEIGRIEAYIEEGKQALEQRLIDAAKKRAFTSDRYYVVELDELLDIIDAEFRDKQI